MGFFQSLFSKPITSKDMKLHLMKVERERRRKQLDLRKLDNRKGQVIEDIKKARKSGNSLQVDYLWEDLSGIKIDSAFLLREARILNLEGIGLKKYIRGMERLEKKGDKNGIKKLFDRIRTSGLDSKLGEQEINDQEYLAELQNTLEELGLEAQEMEASEDDPEKARFLAEIDEINAAEEAGEFDRAIEKEAGLKAKIQPEKLQGEDLDGV